MFHLISQHTGRQRLVENTATQFRVSMFEPCDQSRHDKELIATYKKHQLRALRISMEVGYVVHIVHLKRFPSLDRRVVRALTPGWRGLGRSDDRGREQGKYERCVDQAFLFQAVMYVKRPSD